MITVISTAITAVTLIIVQIIISVKQNNVNELKTKLMIEEIKKDISRLETKQDKHNTLIERMTVVETQIKNIYHSLEEMK